MGELDEALVGASAGDELDFDAEHPDPDEEGLHFVVSVKEVKERVLPEPDDAWAAEASEFETIAELRDDLANRMTAVRKMQAQMSLREKVSDALAELVDVEVPEALVNNEMQQRLQDFAMRLQAQGLTLDQWLENSGQDRPSSSRPCAPPPPRPPSSTSASGPSPRPRASRPPTTTSTPSSPRSPSG